MDLSLRNIEGLSGDVKICPDCSDHDMVISGEGQKQGSQRWTSGKKALASLGSAWDMGHNPREKAPKELVLTQGLSPPNSRTVHRDQQEIKHRQQEACMDEHH